MHVRFAAHEDIPALIRLRFDFFDDDPHMAVTGEKRAQIAAQLHSYYERHLNRDFFAALAEVEGSPAGEGFVSGGEFAAVSFLVLHEKPANYRFPTGKTGEILNVFTYIQYRLNGYASATLKALIDKARRRMSLSLSSPLPRTASPSTKSLALRSRTAPTARKWCCCWYDISLRKPSSLFCRLFFFDDIKNEYGTADGSKDIAGIQYGVIFSREVILSQRLLERTKNPQKSKPEIIIIYRYIGIKYLHLVTFANAFMQKRAALWAARLFSPLISTYPAFPALFSRRRPADPSGRRA